MCHMDGEGFYRKRCVLDVRAALKTVEHYSVV
jgi:hypothetical protein